MEAMLIAAMQSELDALLTQELIPLEKWEQLLTDEGYTYFRSKLTLDNKEEINLIAATQPAQGPTAAIAHTNRMMRFKPDIVMMIGICAGRRQKEIAMGDIIVADLAIRYDTDKKTAAGMEPQSIGYAQQPSLVQWLNAYCSRSRSFKDLGLGKPPVSLRFQKETLLYTIADVTPPGELSLLDVEKLSETCPDWTKVVGQLEQEKLIHITSSISLTEEGQRYVSRTRLLNGKRTVSADTEPQIRVGTFATGSSVVSDEKIWEEIASRHERRVLALDMEAAAFLEAIAGMKSAPIAFVVKSVSDYAGADKDDSFHAFCKKAAAIFALELIKSMTSMINGKGDSAELASMAERIRLLTALEKKSLLNLSRGVSDIGPAVIQKLRSAGLLKGNAPQLAPSALGRIALEFASVEPARPLESIEPIVFTQGTLTAPIPATILQDRKAWRDILGWPWAFEASYRSGVLEGEAAPGMWFHPFGDNRWLVEILVDRHAYQESFMLAFVRIEPQPTASLLWHDLKVIDILRADDRYVFCGFLDVDSAAQSFSIFTKGRGIGDIGVFERYQVRDQSAVLTERRERLDINDDEPSPRTPPETWPVTYEEKK